MWLFRLSEKLPSQLWQKFDQKIIEMLEKKTQQFEQSC